MLFKDTFALPKGTEFEQTLRDGEGRGACYASVHGITESDST